ncbi:hypothetical protein [Amycolatopsis plumensis]|uniref:Orc1-like AAA ATPase domain-containing protein n=1 Tax=Amycolatopsis plumensis TaxID=236508 RepID=A0ABV5UAD3_9PSEU
MWQEFGFQQSPYATEPVPPTREGDHILVGREAEISMLESRILAGGNHPTLEGDNGVGKTSLLSVTCYRLRNAFESGQSSKLFIPLKNFFQPTSAQSVDEFIKKVYFEVASTIVDEFDSLKQHAAKVPNVADVKAWLRSPLISSLGGSASLAGFGAGFTRGRSSNGSEGFSEAGFRSTIDVWLRELFPSTQAGGFICVIDNLELLETTQEARKLLEEVRDPLFNRRGLRWILCGARGIVRTSVSSPRLEGRISDPIDIAPLSDSAIAAAIERRIASCRSPIDAVAPVGSTTFTQLYEILNRNLRNAFKYAEDFSLWLKDEGAISQDAVEYARLFEVWLTMQADKHRAQTELGNTAWQVFDNLAGRGGSCSPSDFPAFGFKTTAAMRAHIRNLERENLVFTMVNDDTDKRRKTIVMTPRGWLVRYARNGYRAPGEDPAGLHGTSSQAS